MTPIPYVDLQKLADEMAPWGSFAYEKGLYLNELSDEVIEVVVRYLTQEHSTYSTIGIYPLGTVVRAGAGRGHRLWGQPVGCVHRGYRRPMPHSGDPDGRSSLGSGMLERPRSPIGWRRKLREFHGRV